MLEFYVKTANPVCHIEACSIINYFLCEIISDRICGKDEDFYGVFLIKADPDVFEIFSNFSSGITLEYHQDNIIR